MRKSYLGDSYDLGKCFWYESLKPIAPLYSHPRFVASAIRTQYTALTSIPILDSHAVGPFGILFDPNTGIPLPTDSPGVTNASHASLPFMVQTDDELHPQYMWDLGLWNATDSQWSDDGLTESCSGPEVGFWEVIFGRY